jgi:hypothetical protein
MTNSCRDPGCSSQQQAPTGGNNKREHRARGGREENFGTIYHITTVGSMWEPPHQDGVLLVFIILIGRGAFVEKFRTMATHLGKK